MVTDKSQIRETTLTCKLALDLHQLGHVVGRLEHVGRVPVQVLLADVKEVVARHVGHRLAPAPRHDGPLDLDQRLPVAQLDLEAVARQRPRLLPQNKRLALPRDEGVKHADRLGHGGELRCVGHFCYLVKCRLCVLTCVWERVVRLTDGWIGKLDGWN